MHKMLRPLVTICRASENWSNRYETTVRSVWNMSNIKSLLGDGKETKGTTVNDLNEKIPESWSQPKVVVIGAGVAGLSAAQRLIENGIHDVTVLEATERPGSRIQTCWFANSIAELGASAINGGCVANSAYTLALKERLVEQPAVRQDSFQGLFHTSRGRLVNPSLTMEAEALFCHFESVALSMYKNHTFTSDADLETFIQGHIHEELMSFPQHQRQDVQLVVNAYLRELTERTGASLDCVTTKYFGSRHTLPGGNVEIPLGFVGLLAPLLKEIPVSAIKYSKPVESIFWDVSETEKPRACVKCDDQEFAADYVIITTPLGFLKENTQNFFVPNLPLKKMEAIKKLGFGHVNNIYLQFSKPICFKHEGPIRFAWHTDDYNKCDSWVKGLTSLSVNDDKGLVLKGTVTGKEAVTMETLDEQQIISDIEQHLHRFSGNYTIPKPTNILMSKWSTNQFTRGAFTYIGTGSGIGHIKDLATPVPSLCDNQTPVLLFAGEHTSPHYYATTHGAIDSGIREADVIIECTKLHKGAPSKQPKNN